MTCDFEDSGVLNSSSFSRKIHYTIPGSKSLPQFNISCFACQIKIAKVTNP